MVAVVRFNTAIPSSSVLSPSSESPSTVGVNSSPLSFCSRTSVDILDSASSFLSPQHALILTLKGRELITYFYPLLLQRTRNTLHKVKTLGCLLGPITLSTIG